MPDNGMGFNIVVRAPYDRSTEGGVTVNEKNL